MILSPSFTFSLLLATLYGALTHLILGGNGRVLLVFILASWVGFAIGQGVGQIMNIRFLAIGPTYVFPATLGSVIALLTTVILTRRQPPGA